MLTKKISDTLPITFDCWNDYQVYDLFSNMYDRAVEINHIQESEKRYITVKYDGSFLLPSITNADKRTINKMILKSQTVLPEHDGYTCLMPKEVWAQLTRQLNDISITQRRSISRVFIYLYYYSMRFQGSFSHSRERMLKELRINNHTLSIALSWLETKEFIVRSSYSMRPQERFARRYYIPEKFWSLSCKKEWSRLQKLASNG